MRVRWLIVWVCAGLVLATPVAASAPEEAAPVEPVPGDTVPVSTVPGETVPVEGEMPPARGPLVVVPAGCAVPTTAVAVFEGRAISVSATAARFTVLRVLAGTVEGRERAPGVVDVQYGEEARFLEVGTRYIVGVTGDGATGILVSKVRAPAPLFGGDAVIGMNDSDIDCPRVEDPVRTLLPDGSSVDSGVLTPLEGERGRLLAAIFVPVGVAFAALVVLVLFKSLLFATGRSLRELGDAPPPPRRTRRHRSSSGGDPAAAR